MGNVGSLLEIRRRIRSVENTKKITRAMEMVAAAKLRRFEDLLHSAQPYVERFEGLLGRLLGELPPGYDHPYLEKSVPAEISDKIALVLFTSDTGLCGTYNRDLVEKVLDWERERPEKKVSFLFVGKQGAKVFRGRKAPELGHFFDLRVSRVEEILEELGERLSSAFLRSEVGEIVFIYARMESLSRFQTTAERFLPFSRPQAEGAPIRYILEPNSKTVLDKLIPAYFEIRLRFVFYHALLTEQIARMTAMRQATQNAKEMIDELTLLRNKARQAAITKEIIEIVSGSRAQRIK
jgi:F-type H+-transporting ATPase subunit gamma